MKIFAILVLATICALTGAFAPSPRMTSHIRKTELHMGGKQAKFGIFSPAVYAAKFVLGESELNKVRNRTSTNVICNIPSIHIFL
jgi:K+-transporting ATPase A subunit